MVCLCGCSAFEVLEFLHVDLFRNVGPAFIHSEAGEFGEKFVEQNVLFIIAHLYRERICNCFGEDSTGRIIELVGLGRLHDLLPDFLLPSLSSWSART